MPWYIEGATATLGGGGEGANSAGFRGSLRTNKVELGKRALVVLVPKPPRSPLLVIYTATKRASLRVEIAPRSVRQSTFFFSFFFFAFDASRESGVCASFRRLVCGGQRGPFRLSQSLIMALIRALLIIVNWFDASTLKVGSKR